MLYIHFSAVQLCVHLFVFYTHARVFNDARPEVSRKLGCRSKLCRFVPFPNNCIGLIVQTLSLDLKDCWKTHSVILLCGKMKGYLPVLTMFSAVFVRIEKRQAWLSLIVFWVHLQMKKNFYHIWMHWQWTLLWDYRTGKSMIKYIFLTELKYK